MRKLLKAILHAPKFTTDELYTIFTAKKLMTAKTPFAHALLANDAITGRRISTAFIEAAAVFEDLYKFNDDMQTAWNTVQLQKPRKKDRKNFGADDAVPILAATVPDDMSTEDLKKIKDYLKQLNPIVRQLITETGDDDNSYGVFSYSITQIEGAVNLKLPLELQEPMYLEVEDELLEPLIPDVPAMVVQSQEQPAPVLPADVNATTKLK
jgi:methionine-rich copper-binding protein CopC